MEQEDRSDFRLQEMLELGVQPPKWYDEFRWPCYLEERYGTASRVEGVEDPDKVREEMVEVDRNRRYANPTGMQGKRKLEVSDVSDDEDADVANRKRRTDNNETMRRGENREAYSPEAYVGRRIEEMAETRQKRRGSICKNGHS